MDLKKCTVEKIEEKKREKFKNFNENHSKTVTFLLIFFWV